MTAALLTKEKRSIMAPRIRVNKLGEPLVPVSAWVPASWLDPMSKMARAEQIRAGNAGVVEVALQEALIRRGLLGGEQGKEMHRDGAVRNRASDLSAAA